jgi:hypothetical protein
MHGVTGVVGGVKVVADSRQRAVPKVEYVLRGVAHAVDEAVGGEVAFHGLFQRRVQVLCQVRPATLLTKHDVSPIAIQTIAKN